MTTIEHYLPEHTGVAEDLNPALDLRDRAILAERRTAFNKMTGPRVGDFIRFSCGTVQRIAHIWEWGNGPESIQPGNGSFYFGPSGHLSMSGGLDPGLSPDLFEETEERLVGRAWFFHHDHHRAHNGIDVRMNFRVYAVNQPAWTPRARA